VEERERGSGRGREGEWKRGEVSGRGGEGEWKRGRGSGRGGEGVEEGKRGREREREREGGERERERERGREKVFKETMKTSNTVTMMTMKILCGHILVAYLYTFSVSHTISHYYSVKLCMSL